MVFLRHGARPQRADPRSVATGPADEPHGGSRRDKGGSPWLAEQRRLRAVREAQTDAPAAKHCWVVDPRWPGRHAGLLLSWERTTDGWLGRVALAPDRDAELVVALVPAVYLEDAARLTRRDPS